MSTPNTPHPAERYTHGHHESVLRSHGWRTLDNSAAYLVPHLVAGQTLLDVGSGPGTMTVEFAQRLAPGRVVGLDASAEVVALATEQGADVENLEFTVGDAYRLPFDDDSFDLVHAHQVLQHLADPVLALREMRRVAKPGGVVAARDVDYHGTVWHPELPGLALWMDTYQAVHRGNGGEPDAGRRLTAWALAAGFVEVATSATVWCFASDADRSWWGGMWADRALQSAFAPDALRNGHATQEQLQQISDAWTAWSTDPSATLIMPHGEIVCRA